MSLFHPIFDRLRALPRARRAAAMAAVLFALALGAVSGCARWAIRQDAKRDRDPATGVAVGTEAVWLHPAPANDRHAAVLLVHGFMGSRKDFNELGGRLAADGWHVRLLRLPGCGTDVVDCGQQDAAALQKAVRVEFDAAKAQYGRVSVVGFSMGGVLSTLLAADGAPMDRLVLVAPAYGVTYRWYYGLPPEYWNNSVGWLMPYTPRSERLLQVNRPRSEVHSFVYHAMSTRAARTLTRLGRRARAPETLAKIQCPALMVMSEGDGAASPYYARRAFAEIGSADKREHWLPAHSNHQVFWDYDGEEAVGAILSFLSEANGGGRSG